MREAGLDQVAEEIARQAAEWRRSRGIDDDAPARAREVADQDPGVNTGPRRHRYRGRRYVGADGRRWSSSPTDTWLRPRSTRRPPARARRRRGSCTRTRGSRRTTGTRAGPPGLANADEGDDDGGGLGPGLRRRERGPR